MDAICGVGELINSIDGEASAASLGNMNTGCITESNSQGNRRASKAKQHQSKNGNSVKNLMTPNLCANVAAVMLPTYQAQKIAIPWVFRNASPTREQMQVSSPNSKAISIAIPNQRIYSGYKSLSMLTVNQDAQLSWKGTNPPRPANLSSSELSRDIPISLSESSSLRLFGFALLGPLLICAVIVAAETHRWALSNSS